MAHLKVTIRADAPLSLGATKSYGGTLIETNQYVSGGQLRGALGALRHNLPKAEQEQLDQLLGTPDSPGVNFPNCYLTCGSGVPAPLPLTAQTCKRRAGFTRNSTGRPAKNHGVTDTLLWQLAYDHIARDGAAGCVPLPFQARCQRCGHRTEPYNGVGERVAARQYRRLEVSTHRQTRVALNRARLTAEENQLYSVQALDEGSFFCGETEVDQAFSDLARRWLPRVTHLGGRVSRGFGRVNVTVTETQPATLLDWRITRFNEQYQAYLTSLAGLAAVSSPDNHYLFTVNLRSDALLRTAQGGPTTRLAGAMLSDACNRLLTAEEKARYAPEKFAWELRAAFTQPGQVSGWQTAWHLPKEVWLASAAGGLYVFAADTGGKPAHVHDLIALLKKLEAAGLGLARADGFGQITICDPFHLEVTPV